MKLHLKRLQTIAKETMLDKKLSCALKEDVLKVFGSTIIVENQSLDMICRQVNDLLETFRRTGKDCKSVLQTTLLTQLMNQNSVEARKLAAQLLPERLSLKLAFDKNSSVRTQVANRAPLGVVVEMCKRFPDDDELSIIKEQRLLQEFDAKNLQKLEKDDLELSDGWYHQQARKLIDDYGELSYGLPRRVDRIWKVPAVNRLCASLKASYNIVVDAQKLLDVIDELLEELDTIRTPSLKEIKQQLQLNVKRDLLNETRIMPCIEEQEDKIKTLFQQRFSSMFTEQFETTFSVKKSTLSGELKSRMLQEGIIETITVPTRAFIQRSIDVDIEQVFDSYVSKWNKLNENCVFKLCWNIDVNNDRSIIFGAKLK